jgi:hypothetical protein
MLLPFVRNSFAGAIALVSLFLLVVPAINFADFMTQDKDNGICDESVGILLEIHREVKKLGYRAEEDFIKREFHFDLDGVKANREEHVVILSHKDGNGERMILQVTTFGKAANQYFVRYPVDVSEILCYIEGDSLQIRECGYGEKEARALLPEILKGIRSEIELLRRLEYKK